MMGYDKTIFKLLDLVHCDIPYQKIWKNNFNPEVQAFKLSAAFLFIFFLRFLKSEPKTNVLRSSATIFWPSSLSPGFYKEVDFVSRDTSLKSVEAVALVAAFSDVSSKMRSSTNKIN